MTLIHDGEKPAFRLGWPFFLRAPRQPAISLKTPKILTREELKELFSSKLSQPCAERRERPLGMRQGGRFSA